MDCVIPAYLMPFVLHSIISYDSAVAVNDGGCYDLIPSYIAY